jgi:hypothetical protein
MTAQGVDRAQPRAYVAPVCQTPAIGKTSLSRSAHKY